MYTYCVNIIVKECKKSVCYIFQDRISYAKLIIEVNTMKELQSFLTSSELIIVYTVIGILLMGTAIFFITKKTYSHRKRKQNTKELNKLVGEVHEKLEEDKINKSRYYRRKCEYKTSTKS